MHRVWGRERVGYRSWAIGQELTAFEQQLWHERGIESFGMPLDDYLENLERRLTERVGR